MRLMQNEEYQKHYQNKQKNKNTKANQSCRETGNIGIGKACPKLWNKWQKNK